MKNTIAKRLISILIGLLLLSYIGYQIYHANYSKVKTETAVFATAADTVQTNGFIIRKETLLTQPSTGVVMYEMEDGGKVSKGGTVASVYTSAQGAVEQQKKSFLETQLTKLTKLNQVGEGYAANPDTLSKQTHQELYQLLEHINANDHAGILSAQDELLYMLNEWQVVTGKVQNFNDRIRSLNTQIAALTGSNGQKTGTVIAPVSGYFIAKTDGYESLYPYEDPKTKEPTALDLTVDDLKKERQPAEVPENVIGKICENFDWYMACVISPETALRLKEGNQITVSMPFATNEDIPARIVAVNQKDKESEAAVILECSYMNQSLADARDETVRLKVETYEGIRVSQKAVHFETITKETTDEEGNVTTTTREVKGVYVLHGSEIQFVEIVPVFSNNDYVICKQELSEDEQNDLMTESSITLYDEVVVGGTDLYDGKIVK